MNSMTHGHTYGVNATKSQFSTDPTGLPTATAPQTVELRDGGVFALRASAVARRIGDTGARFSRGARGESASEGGHGLSHGRNTWIELDGAVI